jgi:hypothetical protein
VKAVVEDRADPGTAGWWARVAAAVGKVPAVVVLVRDLAAPCSRSGGTGQSSTRGGCGQEVSPVTEAFDRGEKWARYQTWLPKLNDYPLVSQTKPRIDHFHRRAGGEWVYSLVNNLEESLRLNSVGCVLELTDVYDRIVFPRRGV